MKAAFKATDPDNTEFTMTITMTLAGWKRLRNQLGQEYPGFGIADKIANMVSVAERSVWNGQEDDDGR